MHAVVNHLKFAEPVPPELIELMRDVVPDMCDGGCRAIHVVQVDPRHLVLLIHADDAATLDRLAREVGGPLMNEHVVPLLAEPTARSLGEVVVSWSE